MNRFKKISFIYICVEILAVMSANFYIFWHNKRNMPTLEKITGEAGTIYKVTEGGRIGIETIISVNVCMGIVILMSIFFVIYITRRILKPFSNMENMTSELAKGNLATPIKEDKNHYFGKFLWGMDMLRDTLESNKEKELKLQKEKKTLILSLTHDIKTPLSAIDLYAKALREKVYETEADREKALDGILKNAQEIKKYVNEITEASKEDFLNLQVDMEQIYLSSVIKKISDYYTDKLEEIHTDFLVEEYEDCLISADSDRLLEVLQNIIENAIKYGDGEKIAMHFSEEEDCRLITVSNSGCSVREEELPNLFDSFYRGSNASDIKGSGLGLYIAKQLMHMMGGDVFPAIQGDKFAITVVIQKI